MALYAEKGVFHVCSCPYLRAPFVHRPDFFICCCAFEADSNEPKNFKIHECPGSFSFVRSTANLELFLSRTSTFKNRCRDFWCFVCSEHLSATFDRLKKFRSVAEIWPSARTLLCACSYRKTRFSRTFVSITSDPLCCGT